MIRKVSFLSALPALLISACGPEFEPVRIRGDFTNQPLAGLTAPWRERFWAGDEGFDQVFRAADGLGPVYIRKACAACHAQDGKGPGAVTKMTAENASDGTPLLDDAQDAEAFPFGHTVRPYVAGPGTQPVLPPSNVSRLQLSLRVGPAVFGRGLLEAVRDDAIVAQAQSQATRNDGIRGVVNWVVRRSASNPESDFHDHRAGERLIGRFGLKARIADIDDFVADAYQNDMGITSPLRPLELPNPDGWQNDGTVDIDANTVNRVADYVRLLAMPRRPSLDTPGSERGGALFAAARCDGCHVPSLPTRADYPVSEVAGRDAALYTDVLVHDMGDALADGLAEGMASGRHWRTAPLVGLRHFSGYLHDGRAASVREAIMRHASAGSEANDSVARFAALPAADQDALTKFVEGL